MTSWLLKLLGADTTSVVRVADASIALRGGMSLGWWLLLLAAAGAGVWWLYRKNPVQLPPGREYLLMALRFTFVGLLLLLLMRPILSLTVEGNIRRLLVLLVDGSASMQIQDPRVDPDDQKRVAIARNQLDPVQGLKQSFNPLGSAAAYTTTRLEVVQQALKNERLNLLPRLDREFDLSAFSFGDTLREWSVRNPTLATNTPSSQDTVTVESFPWVDELTARTPVTAIGDALREVLNRKRGQPLAGVVLLTDGANNSGSQPREAAALCRQEGLPLHIYGVGITSPRDIILANLLAPDVTFAKDELAVTARVRGQGLSGESAELVLKLDGQTVANRTLRFDSDAEQSVVLEFIPPKEGEFELTAEIAPRPDETVQDNNQRAHHLRVVDTRIKVLLADQSPRWEFRYLQAMLLRDRRVDLKCWLAEGDPAIARTKNSPYLERFPSRKEDLFQYDLVIFGDLDPKLITAAQLDNLNEWVSRFGGALVALAGRRYMPHAYRRGLLIKLLPVEYDTAALESSQEPAAEKPVQLELTALGRTSPMLRLSEKPDENAAAWKQLPPVYWVARVSRPKPAAEVLLVDPDPAKESRFGKMPVVALQQYGLGQVLYVGTDNTWRWRKNVGDTYYTALWGQIAQRLSLARLLGSSKRTQLISDRQNYLTGDRIAIYARLYSSGYDPLDQPSVRGLYSLKNGQGPTAELLLRPVPDQPGLYQGDFIAAAPGAYQFIVEHDPRAPLDFNVTEPRFEFGETAMNQALLRDLAQLSGGAYYREEDLHALPETISRRTERVRSPLELELWASPLYFLLLLAVVTAEWVLRKWWHLK